MPENHATMPEYAPEIHSVQSLTLTHFRNHAHTALRVAEKCVALYGENGAGKTNILEAISLLAPGRGFRRGRLADMDGSAPWTVAAEVNGTIGVVHIGTMRDAQGSPAVLDEGGSMDASERRIVRVDGQPLKSPNQLAEYLSVLWLTPQSDMLFSEGGTVRRKFLDRLVFGFDASHAKRVNRYEAAMRERNRLLALPASPPLWFDAVEAQMAEMGAAIAFARQQAIEHINAVMQMSDLSFPKAHLQQDGTVESWVKGGRSASEVEQFMREQLSASRAGDAYSGRSSVGTHRSEFTVFHLGKQAEAARCSTGEQKALLLAIILAEARAAALWHERVPVILLDEVAAHLDPQKRAELYKEIQSLNIQVWMSGVSRDLFKEMHDNTAFFRVEQGKIFTE